MKKGILGVLAAVLIVGSTTPAALAYHCPLLVKECKALVAKLEKKPQSDKKLVAQAKQGCEEALQLHETGNHADAVIAAGEAIALAGKSMK